jgi:hypothetical protein
MTVCPCWATAAAALIVQNGVASLPLVLPVSEQFAPDKLST